MHRQSRDSVPSLAEYFGLWKVLHNAPDVDPQASFFLRTFLTIVYRLARPFARAGVSPNTVTVLGVVQGFVAFALAFRWPAVAAFVVLASSFTDGVDGCVAALTDRATQFGAVFDSVADRVTEWCFVGAAVVAGGDARVGVAAAASVVLFEYARARLLAVGVREVGVVTIGERPTRVIACTIGCLLGAASLKVGTLTGATIALAVVVLTSLIALGQFLRWARPHL